LGGGGPGTPGGAGPTWRKRAAPGPFLEENEASPSARPATTAADPADGGVLPRFEVVGLLSVVIG